MSLTDEINAISDKVLALEQENEELRQQLKSYQEIGITPDDYKRVLDGRQVTLLKGQVIVDKDAFNACNIEFVKIEAYDKLIDLLESDILWKEAHLTERTSDKMKSIVAAYRAVRPK